MDIDWVPSFEKIVEICLYLGYSGTLDIPKKEKDMEQLELFEDKPPVELIEIKYDTDIPPGMIMLSPSINSPGVIYMADYNGQMWAMTVTPGGTLDIRRSND